MFKIDEKKTYLLSSMFFYIGNIILLVLKTVSIIIHTPQYHKTKG